MEAKATIRHAKISPRKLRFLTDAVKAMKPTTALDRLGLSQKRSAKVLWKAIKSAVDNGKTVYNMLPEKMEFKTLAIDEGVFLKRYRAGSRGTGKPYKRRTSHITVVLFQKEGKKVQEVKSQEAETKMVEAKAEKVTATKKPVAKKIIKKS
jgi:large subunit ribosomal protein L22